MKKIVYIAGPITSDPDYKAKFDAVAKEIEEMGYTPYNPTWQPLGLHYKQYIDMGLDMLKRADAVVFLEGWQHSRGATLELNYCNVSCVMPIFHGDSTWRTDLREALK